MNVFDIDEEDHRERVTICDVSLAGVSRQLIPVPAGMLLQRHMDVTGYEGI